MGFCLDDGAELLYGPAAPLVPEEGPHSQAGIVGADEPATATLDVSTLPNEAATQAQIHTTERTAVRLPPIDSIL